MHFQQILIPALVGFVEIKDELPEKNSIVCFEISIKEEEVSMTLNGKGEVKWLRTASISSDYPRGCGIEFKEFTSESLVVFLNYFEKIKDEKPYIPNNIKK